MIWIKPQLAVAAVLLTVCGYVSVGGEYMRVCYYANWAQYRPSVMRFIPSNINPTLCTHIMYAFAKILPDTNSLGTTENNDDGLGGNYKKVTDLKTTAPGLKVLLAVGGWNHTSSGFTDVVSTDTRIDAFCDNVITFLRTRNFDGLDIDWEFPGQRGGNAGDKQRYTKLVARLRQKFNAETGNQNTLILSASVSGSRNTIDSAYEVSSISTYFDFVNIMAYDYQGSWSTGLDHGSPLYPRSDQQPPDSYTNADYAVRYWIAQGMPAAKVVLGIPLYGKAFQLKSISQNNIGDPYARASDNLPYYKICSGDTPKPIYQFQYRWQEEQNASYAYDSVVWVGYETMRSIEIKANYIKDMNLGGAMVFEISQDDFYGQFCNQGAYPLLTKLKQVLQFSKDQCEAGTYVDASVYRCVDCPVDTYQDQVSQPNCTHCPGNNQTKSTRSTGSYFCHTPCPEGQEFDTQDSTCKLCPVNYYKDAQPSSRVCIKCPQGQKSLTRGSTGCVPLTSGEVLPQLDRMSYTITLQFTAPSCDRPELYTTALLREVKKQMLALSRQWEGLCSTNCDNIVVNDTVKGCQTSGRRRRQTTMVVEMDLTFNNIPQEVQQNSSTGPGMVRSTRSVLSDYFYDKTVFKPLDSTYQLAYNSLVTTSTTLVCVQPGYVLINALCEPCPVGTAQVSGSCVICDVGFYQNNTGMTACTKCPQYMTTTVTAATSEDQCFVRCPPGTRKSGGTCIECPVGQFQSQFDIAGCNQCPEYYTTNSNGSTAFSDCILNCPAGMKEASDTCEKCPIGEYQDQIRAKTCKPCLQYKTTNTTGATSADQCFLQCPAGYKQQSETCEPCPIGQYQDQVGSTSCKTCLGGQTTNSTGAASSNQCFSVSADCPKGTKDVSGTCIQCPLNYYQDLTGQTDCKPCQPNRITRNIGATSSNMCILHCPTGSMEILNSCADCPRGEYQNTPGSTSCKSCPKFKITLSSGSKSLDDCILQCPAGYKQQSGTCEPCPIGQYQDQINSTSCKTCSGGQTTNTTGAVSSNQCFTASIECSKGSKDVSGTCVLCPLNYYQDQPGQTNCKPCQPNRITTTTGATSSSMCILHCPTGSMEILNSCVGCPRGEYQDTPGSTSCKSCPKFKITVSSGSKSPDDCILQCPAGTRQVSETCEKCPVGKYQDRLNMTFCYPCLQDKTTNDTGATSPNQCFLQCSVGFKAESGTCVACPIGQYQDEVGALTCKTCRPFTTTKTTGATSQSQCVLQCPTGTKEESGQCKKCPRGQYQDGVGATTCKNCSQYKTTSDVGSTSLTDCFLWCPVGTSGDTASDTCLNCPIGQYQDAPGSFSCKNCSEFRTTRSIGSTSINQCFLQCPVGAMAQSGTCVKCPIGLYQDEVGSSTCKDCLQFKRTRIVGATSSSQCFLQCPIGTKEAFGTCQSCPLGQYQDVVGATSCKNCPQYKTTSVPGATSKNNCLLQCPIGFKVDSETCVECPVGQYQDKINASFCNTCRQFMTTRTTGATSQNQCFFVCPVGRKLESGTCVLCPVGQYQNETGSTICKTCPEFKTTTSVGSTSSNQCVLHCPVGRKQDSGTCVKCPIGQYQDTTGQTVCKSCGVNKITTQTGSTTENQCILQCPAGTMKVSDVCIACPIGKYQDGIDSNTCKDCPQWKTTVSTGMTSLTNCIWNCPQGMKEEGNACVPCPIGQYQDEIGKKTCNVCQIYQTTNTTGSTSFTDCVPKCLAGWKGERGVCVKCPVGQFQDLVGTTFCKACPKYRTTKSMGSTSVMSCFLQCPTGTMEANGTCNDCQAGQYQDELNAKSCKSCPDHSTSTLVGLTSRDQCNLRCPAGYSEGTGTCVKCAVSYYQDTAGSTTCKPCPQYKYTQYAGATSVYQCILRCPVGTKEVSAQCEECPVDQYQDEMGKTTCKNCLNFRRTNGTGASSPDQCLSPCDMSPNFCQNGGTCLWNEAKPADGMSCACRTRFHGDSCENYTEEADRLGTVIGGAVGGSLALLLILLAILIACACWRSSPKGKRTIIHRNSVDLTEGVYNPYFFLEGKYVLNQSAKIIELVEPAETSTDHDFKKASFTNRTSSHNGSIYTKATSFLDTHEHQDSFMDVGIESDHNPGPGSNQYKSGLPYVDFMNVDDDEVGHGVDHDSKKPGPTMDGEGLYVRKIQV